jgi:hypothetical protein
VPSIMLERLFMPNPIETSELRGENVLAWWPHGKILLCHCDYCRSRRDWHNEGSPAFPMALMPEQVMLELIC